MSMYRMFFCIFLFLTSVLEVFSQSESIIAEHISSNKGLSHSVVLDILQDVKGFLWIATGNGLNRFDGYNFTVFSHDEKDTNSIIYGIVNKLMEDKDGKIWLATAGGADIYDPLEDRFVHISRQILTNQTGKNVQDVFQDSDGSIWLSLSSGYVVSFDLKKKKTETYYLPEYAEGRREISGIRFFFEDELNRLWIGSSMGGIFILDKKNNKIQNILFDPNDFGDVNDITSICRLSKDTFLISGKYLCYFYLSSGVFERVKHFPYTNLFKIFPIDEDFLWIPSSKENKIYFYDTKKQKAGIVKFDVFSDQFAPVYGFTAIYKDRGEVLWLGSLKNGLLKIDFNRKAFHVIRLSNENNRLHYIPGGIFEDKKGRLMVSTLNGNLLCKDKNHKEWFQYSYRGRESDFHAWLYGNFVFHPGGEVWFSSFFWEIISFRPETLLIENKNQHFKKLTPYGPSSGKLSGWAPRKIAVDKNGHIWIAYFDAGLDEYDPITNKIIKHYTNDPHNKRSLSSNQLWTVFAAHDNTIYVGTEDCGFDVINQDRTVFRNYRVINGQKKGLFSNSIRCFHEDSFGKIWIGTSGGGVSCFTPETEEIVTFTKNDGISNNVVYGILEDQKGNIWISTEGGITKIERNGEKIINFRKFFKEDGTGGNEFNINSFFKTQDGRLYFGGNHGITWFYPDSICENRILARPIITGLRLFNDPVKVGQKTEGQVVLPQSITYTKEIALNYRNRDFTIEFTSDHYAVPEKNTFKYMLNGYDQGWKYTGFDRRYATYTNLDPGTYVFKLRAINCDGFENSETIVLKIIIKPPWYYTRLAFVIYVFFIITLLYIAYRVFKYRAEYRNKFIMEKIRREQEAEIARKTHELDMMKVNFFMKITHEFRTPLTLILSPVEKLMEIQKNEELQTYYAIIKRNALRLLTLINQLLDMGKIEAGTMSVVYKFGDLIAYVHDIYDSFVPLSIKYHMKFRFESNIKKFYTKFDADKLEKIITNLLSNSFKYVPEYGTVKLSVNAYANYYEIIVTDNGKGIPPEELPHIFERFYQGQQLPERRHGGTGIGLALVKEISEILKGEVHVKSDSNETTFTVVLPVIENSTQSSDFQETTTFDHLKQVRSLHEIFTEQKTDINSDTPCLLIVEDDEDMQSFLKKALEPRFHVLLASNGLKAIDLALQHIPDCIISDILMPEVDGLSFCKKVKSDERISHIPFIFLTSRKAEEFQSEGLEAGAIDFITKPFNVSLLQKKIENVLILRSAQASDFVRVSPEEWIKEQRESSDTAFLRKAINIIKQHIDDEKFDVDQLAQELAFGRTNLYKKIRALTNMPVSEFIKFVRLHEAARLLKFSDLNVNEIAYKTGFTDPSYFTKCFKKQFGLLPSEYKNQIENR